MKLNKLFRLLVVGGAVLAGAQACGPIDESGASQASTTQPDGGKPAGGGGVDFW